MTDQLTLAVVTAGLSEDSTSTRLGEAIAQAASGVVEGSGRSVHMTVVRLRDLAHGITDMMLTGVAPQLVREALDTVLAADGLVVATPTYKASYSGLFKAFFDLIDESALENLPTVIAATGTAGLLINLIVFVVLGIPTSGGATPPEMLPGFFRVIGEVEPMHQVFVGLRSIMFFSSDPQAGLGHALIVLALWAVFGLLGGLIVTTVYDRIGMHRQHVEQRVAPADLRRHVIERRGVQPRSASEAR